MHVALDDLKWSTCGVLSGALRYPLAGDIAPGHCGIFPKQLELGFLEAAASEKNCPKKIPLGHPAAVDS